MHPCRTPCSTACCRWSPSRRDVSIDLDRLTEHAGWLAYEELPPPAFLLPFPLELERDRIVDFVLTATSINFAFTGFESRQRWEIEHEGRALADADGLHYCLQRALAEGLPGSRRRLASRGGRGGPARHLPRRKQRAAAPRRARPHPAGGGRDAGRPLRRALFERPRRLPGTPVRRRQRLPRDARPRLPAIRRRGRLRRRDGALLEARAALGLDPARVASGRVRLRRPRPPDRVRRLHRPRGAPDPRDHAVQRRARDCDPRRCPDRGRLGLGSGDPSPHDLRLRRALQADQRPAPARPPGDRPAGRRPLVGAVPPHALPAPPDSATQCLGKRCEPACHSIASAT